MKTIILTILYVVLSCFSPAQDNGTFIIVVDGKTSNPTDLTGVLTTAADKSVYYLSLVAEQAEGDHVLRMDFHLGNPREFKTGDYKISATQNKSLFGIAVFNDGPKQEPALAFTGDTGRFTISSISRDGMTAVISGSFEFNGKSAEEADMHTVKGSFSNIRIGSL